MDIVEEARDHRFFKRKKNGTTTDIQQVRRQFSFGEQESFVYEYKQLLPKSWL
jgi:hypothetical protein